MSSESNISYHSPKLLPQKTSNDFFNDDVPSYFVSRVELLQRLGRLLFHFIPGISSEENQSLIDNGQGRSISLDRNAEKHKIDVKISTSGKKIVLTESVDLTSMSGKVALKKDLKRQFVLDLPFPIRATAMRDNYNSEKVPLSHRIITISFDRIPNNDLGDGFKEPIYNEEIEELNEKVNGLWDAGYFLEVKNILCGGCKLNILSPANENSSNESSPPSAPTSPFLENSSVLCLQEAVPEPSHPKSSRPKEKKLAQLIKETLERLEQLDLATEKITTNSLQPPNFDNIDTKDITQPILESSFLEADEKLFNRIRNLPSDGWEELVECWVCHSEDYTPHFSKLFHPSPTTLLVGATYILIHPRRLASYLKPQLATGIAPQSSKLKCHSCNTLLGEILADAQSLSSVGGSSNYENTSETQLVVKINKFSILTNKETKVPNSSGNAQIPTFKLMRIPTAATLLSDLIGKYRYQSSTRFILEDQDTNKAKALIMVLNWGVYLWDNSIEAPNSNPATLTPAVRLCYLDLTPPKPPLTHSTEASLKYRLDNRHIIAQTWSQDESIATLSYPAGYIRQILESFTLILPGLGPAHPMAGPLFQDGYLYLPTQ